MGLFTKIKEGLKKTRESFSASLDNMLGSYTEIDESLFEQLEELLVMADTGVPTAERICEEVKKRVKAQRVTDPTQIFEMLRETVAEMIAGDEELHVRTKPSIILVIGVNGVGKTTTIGKIASRLRQERKKVLLAAADTFRAAAIEQLEVWAERSGSEIVKHPEGSDPASVVYDAIAAAKSRGTDVVICDTAGRLHNKKNLMEELKKINRIIDKEYPEAYRETLVVLDGTTGQNALVQARQFMEAADITGIILTKLDGTAKGGIAVAIQSELGIPVKYVGIGEKIDDLQKFDANDFVNALFHVKEA